MRRIGRGLLVVLLLSLVACSADGDARTSSDDTKSTIVQGSRSTTTVAFSPNAGILDDVGSQDQGRVAMITRPGDDIQLSAVREGSTICIEINAPGQSYGTRACVVPTGQWPSGPLIATKIELDGRSFVVGAVAADRVSSVSVESNAGVTGAALSEPIQPFQTLRFFVEEVDSPSAVHASGSAGEPIAAVDLSG